MDDFIFLLLIFILTSQSQPPTNPLEQKALYDVIHSLNPTFPSTTHHPVAFCRSAPHAVVCESHRQPNQTTQSHITELNFGYFSDQVPMLHCSPNATLNPLLFTSFPHLRKLVFHKCFNNTHKPIHLLSLPPFPPSLQELVFIDNPSVISPLLPFIYNLTSLKTLILVGNAFYGELPIKIGDFHNLEQLNLSRNNLSGELPPSIGMLKKLVILDLSNNNFKGCVPENAGNLVSLVKLNLSGNGFACKIPESFIRLKKLEFLDLSFNHFGNFGVPLFLGEFHKMKEVDLSGNSLSGKIPEIWEKLDGVEKIGFSKMGLVGEIPPSMGVYLKNLTYLGLDNNKLNGSVPEEFGFLLKSANEINLENNNLSGTITFSCGGGVGQKKLKLAGNIGLYLEINASCYCENGGSLAQLNHSKTAILLVLVFIILFVLSYLFLFLK